eukprot:SAG11_NODE_248_length_11654_cov_27.840329_2_plen_84_part_00
MTCCVHVECEKLWLVLGLSPSRSKRFALLPQGLCCLVASRLDALDELVAKLARLPDFLHLGPILCALLARSSSSTSTLVEALS